MPRLLKTCNNLRVQYQRSFWNLMNLLVDFWIICHGMVFSVPILLSRCSALYSLNLVFLINLGILDIILLLVLMGFVILNGWYPIMVYLRVWLGLFLLLVNSNDPDFLPPFFRMLGIRL